MSRQAEDLRLQLGLVDPEGAARDLDPVDDQVVRDRPCGARVGVEQLQALVVRARERDGAPPSSVSPPRPTRAAGNRSPRGSARPRGRSARARDRGGGGARRARVRPSPARRPRTAPSSPAPTGSVQLGLREELCDRRANLALLVVDEIREALCAPPFAIPSSLRDRRVRTPAERARNGPPRAFAKTPNSEPASAPSLPRSRARSAGRACPMP